MPPEIGTRQVSIFSSVPAITIMGSWVGIIERVVDGETGKGTKTDEDTEERVWVVTKLVDTETGEGRADSTKG